MNKISNTTYSKIRMENKKLKDEIEKEKKKNTKFRDFAEELIKFYEKSIKEKKGLNKKSNSIEAYEAEKDY